MSALATDLSALARPAIQPRKPWRIARPLRHLDILQIFEGLATGTIREDDGVLVPVAYGGAGMRDLYIATPVASNAAVKVATVNGTKSVLQVATPSTRDIAIAKAAISFDANAAATPVLVELIQTDVAATVTSLTPTSFNDPNAPASLCVGGASATGYNASAEGTITATRLLDSFLIAPTSGVIYPFELAGEPNVPVSKFLRIRVTSTVVYNCIPLILFSE